MSESNSNNSDDNNDRSGDNQGMPLNPKKNMDEGAEEVTRRIAPAMVTPSLGPMPTVPFSAGCGQVGTSPTVDASPMKAQQQQHHQDESSGIFVWDLPSAPSLPDYHPLEQTAVFVPNVTPSEVASRISDVLRERSIEAQYDNAKARVKCTTVEGVDFRVRLYRGKGQYSLGIIVEVQRRFGTSLVFHSDTQAILNGAQGKVSPPPGPLMACANNNLPGVPVSDEEDDDLEGGDDYAKKCADSSLEMVAKMLKVPGFDSQYLGLQTLSSLVDSEKLSLSTARAVAVKLFQPDNVVGIKVLGYIVNGNPCRNEGEKASQSRGVFDDDDEDDDGDNSIILRNTCLNILANATKAHGSVPEHLRQPLRPALIQDLREAEEHSNTALLSAKCMECFVRDDQDTTELNEVFEIAYKAGQARNASLMRQAQKCMTAIR